MSNTLSRRNALGGIAAALVVGWSASRGSWITAPAHADTDVASVPQLDGSLTTSADALSSFGHDFGRLVTGDPWAVLRPGSVRDVQKVVRYAAEHNLKVAVNGRSGRDDDIESHSSHGQALVPGGVAIDARGLAEITNLDPGNGTAVVEAGVTWADLTNAALEHGMTPPALPDYLHLSVGGTLSVGGIGGTAHRYGLLVDTVTSLEVVTGRGDLVTASPTQNTALFDAALGGGGQCGVIVRATVDLVSAPQYVLFCSLFYDDLETYMAAQEKAMEEERFDAQAGELLVPQEGQPSWRYKLEGVAYFTDEEPDRDELLADLNDNRSEAEIVTMPYRAYAFRLNEYEDYLKANGFWDQQKPWLSLFLPASRTQEFLELIQQEVTAQDLGAGFTICYPYPTSKSTRPMVAQPRDETTYLFDLLRFPPPGDVDSERMMQQNRHLFDEAVRMGGKRYLVGAIPDMTTRDWKWHFGWRWHTLLRAKMWYDPWNVLTPGQGFFPWGRLGSAEEEQGE
ncbi:FAD-binding protein [Lipingzhangella sp. LS1_29]|uniref:FAD-binding protein n=1 Tax=Lipingzhangella rawalii TaxID=2055835 RepID=A0ABU2HC78_9ACTN|nr:FAD-binding protein [Lipingzhangella rawalii]MDS1272454.1 FAD-binding protein [Lipingzhangella rawalii]